MKRQHSSYQRILYIIAILVIVLGNITACYKKDKSDNTKSTETIVNNEPKELEEKKADDISESNIEESIPIGQNEDSVVLLHEPSEEKEVDFSKEFNGINGCVVLYDPMNNTYEFYNKKMCEKQVSPYSTFKIISTLLGLENGVIQDANSKMKYSGKQYPIESWNSNMNLQEAFRNSCVWYFRQVIDKVGEKKVQKALNKISYGNCDISQWKGSKTNSLPDLNGFWLNSSLKISPLEQVKVLTCIFEKDTLFNNESIDILKNIMLSEEKSNIKIYGKTGTYKQENGWFVGFCEKGDQKKYFAVYLDDKKNATGKMAKEIASNILSCMK